MGQSVYLEDFLPIVVTSPARSGSRANVFEDLLRPGRQPQQQPRREGQRVSVLKEHGFKPKWIDGANRPSIREAVMERVAGQMRKRTPMGEAYGINNDKTRWLRVTGDGRPPAPWHFLVDGDEAGYVWDEHMVSEGSKQYRKAKKDGWYEHGQNCKEYLELNFGSVAKKAPEPPPPPYIPRSTWG
jgi:hypothetical protein